MWPSLRRLAHQLCNNKRHTPLRCRQFPIHSSLLLGCIALERCVRVRQTHSHGIRYRRIEAWIPTRRYQISVEIAIPSIFALPLALNLRQQALLPFISDSLFVVTVIQLPALPNSITQPLCTTTTLQQNFSLDRAAANYQISRRCFSPTVSTFFPTSSDLVSGSKIPVLRVSPKWL